MTHPQYVRVRDLDTGHEYSTPGIHTPEAVKVLDEPATDERGRPLPPIHKKHSKKARQASTPDTPASTPADAPENQPEEAN